MSIQRVQARQLPLPSPNLPHIGRNVAVDRFNRQNRDSDHNRDRDLRYDQTVADLERQEDQNRILSEAVLGALGGVVADDGTDAALAAPSIRTPGFNPDAGQPQSLDPRSYGLDVAQRMAGAGHGAQAASALDSVFAQDSGQAAAKDKRYEEVLGLAAKGDPASAMALSRRYGIQIPPQVLQNGQAAHAFLTAGRIYDDARQAASFAQEMMRNGGDTQAAYVKVGPPRGKPEKPHGSVIYDEAGGQPYWAPSGGGALTPFTGAPEGARFRGRGPTGQTDPNLSRSRMLNNARVFAMSRAGPQPDRADFFGDEQAYAAAAQEWQQRYEQAFDQEMGRAAGPGGTAAAAGLPVPTTPSFSMGGAPSLTAPPPEAVQDLLKNTSPRAIAEFDEVFGEGAAERALEENGVFGDPD